MRSRPLLKIYFVMGLAELEGSASDFRKRGTSDASVSQASTASRQPSPSKKHRLILFLYDSDELA